MSFRKIISRFRDPSHVHWNESSTPGEAPGKRGGRNILFNELTLIAVVVVLIGVLTKDMAAVNPEPDLHTSTDETPIPGDGIILHDECTEIWLPEQWVSPSFLDLAHDGDVMKSHLALRTYLGPDEGMGLWYVIVYKGHQMNGYTQTRRLLRQPYAQPQHFNEFRAAIAAAHGSPKAVPPYDFSKARIVKLSAETQQISSQKRLEMLQPSASSPNQ